MSAALTAPLSSSAIRAALRTGELLPTSVRPLGASGATGPVHRGIIRDQAGTLHDVVLKHAEAPREEFGSRIASALELDELVPVAVLRDHGSRVAMQYVATATVGETGFHNGRQLLAAIRDARLATGATRSEAVLQARESHELLEAYDWLLANRDRKPANSLREMFTGLPKFIDNGGALRGERADVLRPGLKDPLYLPEPGTNRIVLSMRTRDHVADRLTDDVLAAAHDVLVRAPRASMPEPRRALLDAAASAAQLDRLIARRDWLVRSGVLEYERIVRPAR